MRRIWLTGGSGSGKSTAANIFKKLGYQIIDCDKISRNIMLPGLPAYEETIAAFGNEILNADKTINRNLLGKIVFTNHEKLEILNAITHKYIIDEIEKSLAGEGKYVIDAPLPNNFGVKCDSTIVITAPLETRINRLTKRDLIDEIYARNRIAAQISDEEYKGLGVVIDNSGTPEELEEKIKAVIL